MSLRPGQVVCFETFRREREPRVLPYLAPIQPAQPASPFRGYELTEREIDHRQRMLRHLNEAG